MLALLAFMLLVGGTWSTIDLDDYEDGFLLGADVGANGLMHLQPLLLQAYGSSSFRAHISAAELHARHSRIADAAASYEHVLANYALSDADAAPVRLALGNALAHLGRSTEAEREYTFAASARTYAHLAYYSLGILHMRTGRTADATQALDMALFFRPAFFSAVHALGSLHIVRGHVEKGLRLYDSALQLLVEAGVLGPEGQDGAHVSPTPSSAAQTAQQKQHELQSAWQAEQLGHHLVKHVLHVFHVPSQPVGPQGSAAGTAPGANNAAARRAAAAATGASLRQFLSKVSSLDLAAFHRGLGLKLADTGALADGIAHLRRSISLSPAEFEYLLIWTTLAQPLAYSSVDDVWATRATTVKNVRQVLEDRVPVVHPEHLFELYQLQYQLPFSGLPAHLLMRDIARLFASSEVPVLPITAPRLFTAYPRAGPAARARSMMTTPGGLEAEQGAEEAALAADGTITTATAGGTTRFNPFLLPTPPSNGRQGGVTIRLGLLSYQTHDSPVGHLFRALAAHLKGYTAAVAAEMKQNKKFDLFTVRRMRARQGGGAAAQLACMGQESMSCEDPLLDRGYVTVPGVAAFHISLIRLTRGGDAVTRALLDSCDQQVYAGSRPFDMEGARKVLMEAELDVLLAADPGIQPELYALLFGRYAPIQAVLWGQGDVAHTLTLGLPNSVDYYIVGDNGAADAIQDQMAEQVVRLGDTGVYFQRMKPITLEERLAASRRHGLLESRHLYLVPATLNALHPAFDDVLLGILAADPAGEALCLYESGQELWLATTKARLAAHPLAQQHGHALTHRVRFTADFVHAAHRDKWALMSASDVVLDTFPVGLSQTALEALEVAVPIVTLPGRQPLRHFAAGVLRRMNVSEHLVASDVQDYINKAVRLAADTEHRRAIRTALMERRVLFEWDAESFGIDKGKGAGLGADTMANISAPSAALLQQAAADGYDDPGRSTLNDWLSFLGRVGRPYASDRKRASRMAGGGAAKGAKSGRAET